MAMLMSGCDVIMVLYAVLSAKWDRAFSIGVIVGLVASNAIFLWALRMMVRPWMHTLSMMVLGLNVAVVFSVNTPAVLLARLVIVLGEILLLARCRSFSEPNIFFV
jgi:hypothetical protein